MQTHSITCATCNSESTINEEQFIDGIDQDGAWLCDGCWATTCECGTTGCTREPTGYFCGAYNGCDDPACDSCHSNPLM